MHKDIANLFAIVQTGLFDEAVGWSEAPGTRMKQDKVKETERRGRQMYRT